MRVCFSYFWFWCAASIGRGWPGCGSPPFANMKQHRMTVPHLNYNLYKIFGGSISTWRSKERSRSFGKARRRASQRWTAFEICSSQVPEPTIVVSWSNFSWAIIAQWNAGARQQTIAYNFAWHTFLVKQIYPEACQASYQDASFPAASFASAYLKNKNKTYKNITNWCIYFMFLAFY